jgi:hypothetical protein
MAPTKRKPPDDEASEAKSKRQRPDVAKDSSRAKKAVDDETRKKKAAERRAMKSANKFQCTTHVVKCFAGSDDCGNGRRKARPFCKVPRIWEIVCEAAETLPRLRFEVSAFIGAFVRWCVENRVRPELMDVTSSSNAPAPFFRLINSGGVMETGDDEQRKLIRRFHDDVWVPMRTASCTGYEAPKLPIGMNSLINTERVIYRTAAFNMGKNVVSERIGRLFLALARERFGGSEVGIGLAKPARTAVHLLKSMMFLNEPGGCRGADFAAVIEHSRSKGWHKAVWDLPTEHVEFAQKFFDDMAAKFEACGIPLPVDTSTDAFGQDYFKVFGLLLEILEPLERIAEAKQAEIAAEVETKRLAEEAGIPYCPPDRDEWNVKLTFDLLPLFKPTKAGYVGIDLTTLTDLVVAASTANKDELTAFTGRLARSEASLARVRSRHRDAEAAFERAASDVEKAEASAKLSKALEALAKAETDVRRDEALISRGRASHASLSDEEIVEALEAEKRHLDDLRLLDQSELFEAVFDLRRVGVREKTAAQKRRITRGEASFSADHISTDGVGASVTLMRLRDVGALARIQESAAVNEPLAGPKKECKAARTALTKAQKTTDTAFIASASERLAVAERALAEAEESIAAAKKAISDRRKEEAKALKAARAAAVADDHANGKFEKIVACDPGLNAQTAVVLPLTDPRYGLEGSNPGEVFYVSSSVSRGQFDDWSGAKRRRDLTEARRKRDAEIVAFEATSGSFKTASLEKHLVRCGQYFAALGALIGFYVRPKYFRRLRMDCYVRTQQAIQKLGDKLCGVRTEVRPKGVWKPPGVREGKTHVVKLKQSGEEKSTMFALGAGYRFACGRKAVAAFDKRFTLVMTDEYGTSKFSSKTLVELKGRQLAVGMGGQRDASSHGRGPKGEGFVDQLTRCQIKGTNRFPTEGRKQQRRRCSHAVRVSEQKPSNDREQWNRDINGAINIGYRAFLTINGHLDRLPSVFVDRESAERGKALRTTDRSSERALEGPIPV